MYLADHMDSNVNILQSVSRLTKRAEGKTFGNAVVHMRTTDKSKVVGDEEIFLSIVSMTQAMVLQGF